MSKVKIRLVSGILLALILISQVSFAGTPTGRDSCFRLTSSTAQVEGLDLPSIGLSWRMIDKYAGYDFSDFDSLLFLAVGREASSIAQATSGKPQVIISNIEPSQDINAIVDSMNIPYADNEFQYVGMNRGLCFCPQCSTTSCGGIPGTIKGIKTFLRGVLRVLDKENPNSVAVLTGFNYASRPQLPGIWEKAVEKVAREYPQLKFRTLYDNGFQGVVVTVDGSTAPRDRLLKLTNMKAAN